MWQYGLQIVKYILPFITLPYLTRVLGTEGYAVYAYVLSFMTFVQVIADFGFNLSGTKKVASASSSDEINRVTGAIMQARLMLCFALGIAVLVISQFIPILRENLFYVFLAYIGVSLKALAPDFVFQGKEQMGPITSRYLISKGTAAALTFVFIHTVADLLWIPVLDIISGMIALVWSFAAMYKRWGLSWARASFKDTFDELKVSGIYCISNVSSTAFSGFSTLLIGIVITDKSQISYWSLAMTCLSAVQALYSPIVNSLYPHMVTNRDFHYAKKLGLTALPFIAIGTALFAAWADPLMSILGGEDYLAGSYVIRLVAPVVFFSFYGMFFGWPILGAADKVKEITLSTLYSALLNIALLLVSVAIGIESVTVIALIRDLTEAVMCFLRLDQCKKLRAELRSS
ncbi:MAG: oligosaccharide flippase family protein [Atopobiaceae bacterium]|nr:oligosaccharide flippase family protein [Atopobiaceae bacterium]